MKLYFDVGNTDIKLNFKHEDKEYYVNFDSRSKTTVDVLYTMLPTIVREAKIKKVLICSVLSEKEELLIGLAKKYWQLQPIIINLEMKRNVEIKTTYPETVGADLISLAAFVANKTDNGIIINAGTTTTISYVKNKELLGAIISPGFAESLNAITNNASQIGCVKLLETNLTYGKTTQEAISIGVIDGHVAMIEGLVSRIDKDSTVFLSGGHSRKLMKKLPNFTYVKEATIEGMKIIEGLNED